MQKKLLLPVILLCAACVVHSACSSAKEGPTAIIVDNDTGQPIEGAVALAQWIKLKPTLFEGGIPEVKKAKEAFSDKEGKIYIDGFWGTYIFSEKPRLTVYKPGYVVWDSEELCPDYKRREDFDKKHRVIKILKFDAEYPKWQKKYSYITEPHYTQDMFFNHCIVPEISGKCNIYNIFYNNERTYVDKEIKEKQKKIRRTN